jgi:hypothetical protein
MVIAPVVAPGVALGVAPVVALGVAPVVALGVAPVVALIIPATLVVPSTRTRASVVMALAEVELVPFWYVVEDASSTVTF